MGRVNPAAVVVSGLVFWFIQAGWYTALRQPYVDALGLSPDQVKEAMANCTRPRGKSPWRQE